MSDEADQLASLLDYVKAEGRICPQPQEWNALWEMLPDSHRVGSGWEPALPLILGAWWHTSSLEKMIRLQEHIDFAASHGVLTQVDAYLRSLSPEQWHTLDQQ